MPWILTPPTYVENAWTRDIFWGRFPETRGICLAIKGTVVTEYQYPWAGDIYPGGDPPEPDYDHVYLGGMIHTITVAEKDALVAAGYGAYVHFEPD